jgi:hypothetical protein
MNENIAAQEENTGFVQWMILRMLYACRPGAASEKIILKVLESLDFGCELNDVREAITYMQSAGLLNTIHGRTGWRARLTKLGVAVVEYSEQAPPGIGRPRKWRSSKK